MTGAMYAAVSGLRTHMQFMNVIGNNISNVNTNGYKAARYIFNEALYTNVKAGSNSTLTRGGTNPAQIGYGTGVGTIDLDMSTKNYTPTGRPGDITIDGDGFLLVGDKDLGPFKSAEDAKALYLTRLGNLGFDEDGWLVDGNGNSVYGWIEVQVDGQTGGTQNPTDEDGQTQNTTTARILTAIRLPMVASDGSPVFPKVENGQIVEAKNGDSVDQGTGGGANADEVKVLDRRILLDSLTIAKNGQITGVSKDDGSVITIGYIAVGQVDNPNGVTHMDGHYYQALDGSGNLHIASIAGVVKPTNKLTEAEQDAAEDLSDGIDIENSGKTEFVPNGLESSGTELATEISNMIMMQRGYQANTRIITVTDSMLEELVNIKR